ncbi:MAG TPA: hypothetical protein PLQ88_13995, partial [Blastocatellia bacterium]|nr:hypothetical protein [Blastocatellia bacterium]
FEIFMIDGRKIPPAPKIENPEWKLRMSRHSLVQPLRRNQKREPDAEFSTSGSKGQLPFDSKKPRQQFGGKTGMT